MTIAAPRVPQVGDTVIWYSEALPTEVEARYEVAVICWVSDDSKVVNLASLQRPGRSIAAMRHLSVIQSMTSPTAGRDGCYVFPHEHEELRQHQIRRRQAKIEQTRQAERERERLGQARAEARNLLLAGKQIADVVAMTGVPQAAVIELAQSLSRTNPLQMSGT